jgi:hypothetical protein
LRFLSFIAAPRSCAFDRTIFGFFPAQGTISDVSQETERSQRKGNHERVPSQNANRELGCAKWKK